MLQIQQYVTNQTICYRYNNLLITDPTEANGDPTEATDFKTSDPTEATDFRIADLRTARATPPRQPIDKLICNKN